MANHSLDNRIVRIFISLAFITLTMTPALAQSGTASDRLRSLNNEILHLNGAIQRARADEVQDLRVRAGAAIVERGKALEDLVERDPGLVLSMILPAEVTADLALRFPEAASSLEMHGTWQGSAERWIIDFPGGSHRSFIRLTTGAEALDVYYASPEPVETSPSGNVQVSGARIGNLVVAASDGIAALSPSDGMAALSSSDIASDTTQCSTTGPQKTAVLLIKFPGVTPPSAITLQSVNDMMFGGGSGYSLNGYWTEASYGKASATGNVFGWYTLSQPYTCATTDSMRQEALNLAAASGVDFRQYSRLFLIVPDMGCGWAGAANMGCATLSTALYSFNASTTYLNSNLWESGTSPAQIAMHEGGHNLGLGHSRSRDFGSEPLGVPGASGTYQEYGDTFSVMGTGGPGHYSAPQKAGVLSWLSSSNYQVVQSSGTWTIAPLEAPSSGLQALKIQRGTGNNAWLWLEYRQPIGYDRAYATNNVWAGEVFSGATIHYEDSTTAGEAYSDLLDFTPASDYGFVDPALIAGQTWTDPYSNLSLTVQSASASELTVIVSYGSQTCTHTNPTVTMTPPNPGTAAGSSVSYSVSLTNNDSGGCSSSNFVWSSGQPGGWSATLSPSSVVVSPGQTVTATLVEAVPASALPATYEVMATAANGAYTATAKANCTVTSVSVPTLTDTLSASGSTYSRRQTASLSSLVLSGGSPASGATVTFTMTKPNGTQATRTTTTGSDGTVTWQYKIGAKDPAGSYTVVSRASFQSQTASSGTVVFVVK
jgi:M6 family metalloprotease-like protein